MTDILQRYGIKEVADVTFYKIEKDGSVGAPVLVLDSLKVTSIEQTAESSEARGGKGNAKLIVWDFGKEITVTIEDALFSPKSLSIMMADGIVENVTDSAKGKVRKSARVVSTETTGIAPEIKIDGKTLSQDEVKVKWYKAASNEVGLQEVTVTTSATDTFEKGEVYIATWEHPVAAKSIITISPDSFPGTYYVTGDTMVRSERTGDDEYFQFVIPKAKMQAEQTISMEAEGDPSTFNMTLQVLRPESGEMMQFIKYEFAEQWDHEPGTTASEGYKDPIGGSTVKDGWNK
jgi:hypothetical protein